MSRRQVVLAALASAMAIRSAVAADKYELDPSHSTIGFKVAHMVINDVSGHFKDFEGNVTLTGGTLTDAKAVIQAKSIDTNVAKRDEHLRGADFFDVEEFPTITFETVKILRQNGEHLVTGKFTMHGVTKEMTFPVTVKGPVKDPWGKTRIALKAATSINRKDYGLTWNKVLEAGGLLVGEEVQIEINAEAVKTTGAPAK